MSGELTVGGYRLTNLMMTGQMSQVWEAVEGASGRHFAVKLLLPENVHSPPHRALLAHEAAVGKRLAHPNVIKIITANTKDKDNPFFVMEFFRAGSLKVRMIKKEQAFIRERAHDIFRQWATALAYMNASGWVHRDVKPDNVLVNNACELRVIDFALARRIQKNTFFSRLFRRRGKSAGTLSYISPEQIRGLPLDGRADIYSFGCSVYEVVTDRPPFRAPGPQELMQKHIIEKPITPCFYNRDVTEEFGALVVRMLAKKPQDRPRDFHEVLMQMRGMKIFKGEAPVKAT